jgi:hypothetical protein
MMELLHFVFQDLFHFVGSFVILWLLMEGFVGALQAIMGHNPSAEASKAFWKANRKKD